MNIPLPINFPKEAFRAVAIEGDGASGASTVALRSLSINTIFVNSQYANTSCNYIVLGI